MSNCDLDETTRQPQVLYLPINSLRISLTLSALVLGCTGSRQSETAKTRSGL
jgi:hypothetical protein